MSHKIEKVGIVGAGTMGQGIAHAVAIAGYQVLLYDVRQSLLDAAMDKISKNLDKGVVKGKVSQQSREMALKGISTSTELKNVRADLIIEAVVEDLRIKTDLFLELEDINSDHTLFATNTSSIPVTRIGSGMKNPGQLAGLHFFNPAHIMKLVEVISGDETHPEVITVLTKFSRDIGKIPVMANDSPGFIVNRVARHYYLESLKILEEGVSDYQTTDDLLENYGFKMGPFKLMDLIGVDVNLAVTQSIYDLFNHDPKYQPNKIQQKKVDAGHLGRKTGKGFYEYK